MDFGLSEEQQLFQNSMTQFLSVACAPERLRKLFNAPRAIDAALWQGLVDLGITGLLVPEAFGGAGGALLDLAVIAEVAGRYALPGPFMEHCVATYAITHAGSDTQKARWLSGLANGTVRATIAFAEPDGVWQSDVWTLDPIDGSLTGDKLFVPYALEADLIVVGLQGGRLGLVERGARGLTVEPIDGVDRTRQLDAIRFADTPVDLMPKAAGARVCDAALVLIAADAHGGACRTVELTVDYAKVREQFGVPIASFQALKHQLAGMALEAEPTLGLYWFAAHAFDRGLEEAPLAAALAKAHITERYTAVARMMIEAHGGIGYTWDYEAHIWLKRALFDRTFMGSPELHRQRIAELAGW
jgi:alkylation response protein AidB-like acyl-CoA dehydrogenase